MRNIIECAVQCDCFNPSLIDSFRSLENHGSKVMIHVDKNANLDKCINACDDNSCQCCTNLSAGLNADLSCTVQETETGMTLTIESTNTNDSLLKQLLSESCCVNQDEEGHDDKNRRCC